MDRTSPSEGGDAGSIPAKSTSKGFLYVHRLFLVTKGGGSRNKLLESLLAPIYNQNNMNIESSGLRSGDEFEYYSLKEPSSSIVLPEDELLELKHRPKERSTREDELIQANERARRTAERIHGLEGRREALKDVIIANQSPSGVVDDEGLFLRPKTRFAEELHASLLEELKKRRPDLGIKVRIFSAVGTLLDLRGVDGIIRVIFTFPNGDKRAADVTIDLTTRPDKLSSASNIIACGRVDTLSNEISLRQFTKAIAEATIELIKKDRKTRNSGTPIFVEAPETVH